jgi:hypothetical protein
MANDRPACDLSAALWLRRAFCFAVVAVALWRFTENSVDPDLWGHVLYGQRALALGGIERAEPFSWTEPGHPWINHEIGAEYIMGFTHRALGGPGLLLLAVGTGLFCFFFALRLGTEKLAWPERLAAWALAALVAKEIAFGFSVRPQIFTAVALVIQLLATRRLYQGKLLWALVLPPLFWAWINTHGGALAGIALLFGSMGLFWLEWLWNQWRKADAAPALRLPAVLAITGAFGLSAVALTINAYGLELLRWLVGSVSWVRPEISEWNPPALGGQHLTMFAAAGIAALSFLFTPRRRVWWEVGVTVVLGVIAIRHARHIPLFGIAALAFVPPHLASAAGRLRGHAGNLLALLARPPVRRAFAAVLALAGLAALAAALAHNKQNPFTIEVPRDEYPRAALEFIRAHGLRGNQLTTFDWGQQVLWELPDSKVSIDGRLDTCYSRRLLAEHWKFFDGKPFDPAVLDLDAADYALLRSDVVGISHLKNRPGWVLVYQDPLAQVFVRDPDRFPKLAGQTQRVTRGLEALAGREPFPDALPGRVLEVMKPR